MKKEIIKDVIAGLILAAILGLIGWIAQMDYIKNFFSFKTQPSNEVSAKSKDDSSDTISAGESVRTPLFRSTFKSDLSEFEMKAMLFNRNFFDKRMNENGDGFPNNFDLENDNQAVVDNATQLIWQQSGSEYRMSHNQAQAYIDSLNNASFAGYSDWRLPTLEEAMSLMEASKRKDDLHIDRVFDHQWAIWTSDKTASSEAWMVSFDRGSCTDKSIDCYVRAVRVL